MLEANGLEVFDLGVNVSSKDFITNAIDNEVSVIGMSALLTTTMPNIGEIITELKEAGLTSKIKTIIGGAPVNQSFADNIGADAILFFTSTFPNLNGENTCLYCAICSISFSLSKV